ncbi:type VI secretion system protein ImpL [Escherichia coli]|nr:type VI secretion system protein ImpL [Escherichia coli]
MNAAPPESEEKLAVLRVMRMLEDKSGRNNEVVKQYMAKRWSEKFHGQRDIQAQLMSHLDYALAHTDWHAERQAGDGDAISRWTPYDKPVVSAQKELSKLPVYQRVYQSLKTRALGVLPADLNLRDQVGPTFDQVFTSADDNKLVVPQFLTRYGLQSYFVKQRDELVELTAMDSWVLNLTRSVKYSDADRAEIQRQLQPLETGMQMMRVADSRWPESLQQQQASTQWNEALKTRAQSSPQLRGWLQTRQDLHAFADLVMQREKEGLTLSYIKNVIWQAERGLGQETPVESLLTQYHDARAQKQNTDALEKQINERLEGVLSRWLLLKNNVMPEAATGTTAEK